MLGYAGWYDKDPYRAFMFFIPFKQLFLIGPVFFFYVKTLLNGQYKYQKQDVFHFVPALLYLGYSLVIAITDLLVLDAYYFYADEMDKDLSDWYQIAGVVSMLFYLFLSLRYYEKYRSLSLQELSYADEIAYKWLRNFIIAFGVILFFRIVFFFTNPTWWNFGDKFWYYFVFSVLLFYISVSGYSHTIKSAIKVRLSPIDSDDLLVTREDQIEQCSASIPHTEEWGKKIAHLFDVEHLYTNPDLTLTYLADRLQSNRSVVSKVINESYKMNFNDFVNEKRAEAVMKKIEEGAHHQSTLLGIALDCGFNSKTTFNRAFKKHSGLSPQQFVKKTNK